MSNNLQPPGPHYAENGPLRPFRVDWSWARRYLELFKAGGPHGPQILYEPGQLIEGKQRHGKPDGHNEIRERLGPCIPGLKTYTVISGRWLQGKRFGGCRSKPLLSMNPDQEEALSKRYGVLGVQEAPE